MLTNNKQLYKLGQKMAHDMIKKIRSKAKTAEEDRTMFDSALTNVLFNFGLDAGMNVKDGVEEIAITECMEILEAAFRAGFNEGRKHRDTKGTQYVQ